MTKTRAVLSGVAGIIILGCGGSGTKLPANAKEFQFGLAFYQATAGPLSPNDAVSAIVAGKVYSAFHPPAISVTNGQPVFFIRPSENIMTGTWLDGNASSVSITSMTSGKGGLMPGVTLQSDGQGNIALGGGVVLPPDRYSMHLDGPFVGYDQDKSKGLTVHRLSFEFDVFSNGFSNLPLSIGADYPRNGTTKSSFTMTGTMPPNAGAGQATLGITPFGGVETTFTLNKALGATTYSWLVNTPTTVPAEGLGEIRLKYNF